MVSIEWPSVAAATTLMADHNPHKPVAVKVSHNSLSWKWYLVSIGDVKAEYDGHCLSFTSFPIHAYQSKASNGRAYCDFKHPIYTATKRRRVDQTLSWCLLCQKYYQVYAIDSRCLLPSVCCCRQFLPLLRLFISTKCLILQYGWDCLIFFLKKSLCALGWLELNHSCLGMARTQPNGPWDG